MSGKVLNAGVDQFLSVTCCSHLLGRFYRRRMLPLKRQVHQTKSFAPSSGPFWAANPPLLWPPRARVYLIMKELEVAKRRGPTHTLRQLEVATCDMLQVAVRPLLCFFRWLTRPRMAWLKTGRSRPTVQCSISDSRMNAPGRPGLSSRSWQRDLPRIV